MNNCATTFHIQKNNLENKRGSPTQQSLKFKKNTKQLRLKGDKELYFPTCLTILKVNFLILNCITK